MNETDAIKNGETVGEIARRLGVKRSRVSYIVVSRNIPHIFQAGKARVFAPDAVRRIEAALAENARDTDERRLSRIHGEVRETQNRLDEQLKIITDIGGDLGANATAILLLRGEIQKTKDFIGHVVEAIAENRGCLRQMAEFMKTNAPAEANAAVTQPAPIDKDFLTLN